MKYKIALSILLLFAANAALADGPGWTVKSQVHRLVVTMNGGVNVRLKPELQGGTSQSGYGGKYASVYPDHPGIDKIYSLLLAAQSSGKDVQIYLADSTCKVGEAVYGGTFTE